MTGNTIQQPEHTPDAEELAQLGAALLVDALNQGVKPQEVEDIMNDAMAGTDVQAEIVPTALEHVPTREERRDAVILGNKMIQRYGSRQAVLRARASLKIGDSNRGDKSSN